MEKKKKIPCRVCGNPFIPCAYCQSHADIFRWRNFACSEKCAKEYINNTVTYRESLHNNKTISDKQESSIEIVKNNINTRKKKSNKTLSYPINDENKKEESNE